METRIFWKEEAKGTGRKWVWCFWDQRCSELWKGKE